MSRFIIYIIFLISCVTSVTSYRILAFFPTPSISHQVVFRPLTQELAKRGHDVTVITTDPAFSHVDTPQNLTEIDVHDISYKLWREKLLNADVTSGKSDDINTQLSVILKLMADVFELQVTSPKVQSLIRNKTGDFDLLMLESCVRPALALTYIFKVPTILLSSLGGFGLFDTMGMPSRPVLLYPMTLRQRLDKLTMWEKLVELYNHYKFEYTIKYFEEYNNRMMKRVFGEDMPTLRELGDNVDMLFLNVHPLWESNRPVPSSVIYMGGLHQKSPKSLSRVSLSY